ncbi:MAG: hypothetical protein LUQ20_08610 [Candidatus Methanoperedens sp.]|nr:hypothetical protein [Candidatus Methanoperedens sp.]
MKKGYFILGFFPAAVLFFIGIFTSMAWNMAFGVYESLTGIPKELVDAVDSFALRGWERLEHLTLPACVPKLVYNSIVSWSWKLFDRIHVFGREKKSHVTISSILPCSIALLTSIAMRLPVLTGLRHRVLPYG